MGIAKARLLSTRAWLLSDVRQLMAAVALLVGGYMVISGLVRLLTSPDRCRHPSAACAACRGRYVRLNA